MRNDEINRVIEDYLKKIRKILPDSFETEDLLEDLRVHINDSYNDKVQKNPDEDKQSMVREVLEALGTPEEIAEEYGKEEVDEEERKSNIDRWIYYTMRLTLVVLVVVLASWVASVLTEGAVDFILAVVVLLAFAVLEWLVRTQQTKDA
ncbi:MAG: hypothetical protein ThorAB25_00920 [Candidatus Thorarchaeota archaeon AB_25]|nr:MAG: hypothetical protein ThorAB25_00920 [Candidatus Thorarchaeota archaeon AB_25]